jgi:hypothetical protein
MLQRLRENLWAFSFQVADSTLYVHPPAFADASYSVTPTAVPGTARATVSWRLTVRPPPGSRKAPCPRPPMNVLPDCFDSGLEPERAISAISDGYDGVVLEEDIHKPEPVPLLALVMSRIKPLSVDGEPLSEDVIPCAVKRLFGVLNRAKDDPAVHIPKNICCVFAPLLGGAANEEDFSGNTLFPVQVCGALFQSELRVQKAYSKLWTCRSSSCQLLRRTGGLPSNLHSRGYSICDYVPMSGASPDLTQSVPA